MRLTLAGHAGSPDLDVDVVDGVRLGDLRPDLAATAGRPEIAGTSGRAPVALAVGDVVLGDAHRTGEAPLVPGAVLRVGAGRPDPGTRALAAAWHLAVVAGPDAGALVPIDDAVVVGRRVAGPAGRPGALGLGVDDPTVSERQVEVAPGPRGPRARDLGSTNGTALVRPDAGARVRRVTRRGRSLAAGDRLVLGATVLEVRSGHAEGPPPRGRPPSAAPAGPPGGLPAAPASWVAPAAGAAVLAAATGNRMLLALAAVGPATALGAGAVRRSRTGLATRRARRRSAHRRVGVPASAATGPVLPVAADLRAELLTAVGGASPARVAAALQPDPAPTRGADGPVLAPWAGGPSARPRQAAPPTSAGPRPGHDGARTRGLRGLAPDGCLAVVGPRPVALAVARLLVCGEVHPPGGAAVGRVAGRAPPVGSGSTGWDELEGDPTTRWGGPQGHPRPRGVRAPAHADATGAWRWTRWLEPGPADAPAVLVLDGTAARPGAGRAGVAEKLDRAGAIPGGRVPVGTTVLLVEEDRTRVPPWCGTVLEVLRDRRTAVLTRPDAPPAVVPLCGVSAAWAEDQARLVHRVHAGAVPGPPGTASDADAAPAVVALADLPGIPPPDPDAVLAAWVHGAAIADPGLGAVLGTARDGSPVVLDLVRDGPHGLVAGTTGAGKSGLLQTWVLALALARPPTDVAMLLVDYKGGAGFGPCAGLPHVVAQVTDLDAALAARALTGLRAELRRRERLLARWGVPDLATLRAQVPDQAPPRLLVVVDEFRALVDDLPDFVPGLLRVAAQGRSLGLHLLLATQRPGGAVGADLRANLALRVALRVTEASESLDVLGVPDAATIPAAAVGRAVLRRGPAPAERLQVAHADAAAAAHRPLVRRADAGAWGGRTTARTGPPGLHGRSTAPAPGSGPEPCPPAPSERWVAAARAAATRAGLRAPAPPWLAPLPHRLRHADLRARPDAGLDAGPGLALALADHPAEQRQSVVRWDVGAGPLLVVGAPGSGRTTALRTVAAAALDRGWQVHAAAGGDPVPLPPDRPGCGTSATADDPRLLARLVVLLSQPGPPLAGAEDPSAGPAVARPPTRLLLVDGLEEVLHALAAVARGRAADALLDLVRDGRRSGVGVVATASAGVPHSVARLFTDRLVLRLGDPVAEAVAGVPADLAVGDRPSGRGVWVPGGASRPSSHCAAGPALCQVALPPEEHRDRGTRAGTVPSPTVPSRTVPSPTVPSRTALSSTAAAPRLRPVPPHVPASDPRLAPTPGHAGGPGATTIPLGLGGDDAGAVRLAVDLGALVVGPPGSGRSTTLVAVARGALAAGHEVAAVARDGPLLELVRSGAPARACGHGAGEVARLLDAVAAGGPCVLLVDDLDLLEHRAPEAAARLADLLADAPEPDPWAAPAAGRGGGAPVRAVTGAAHGRVLLVASAGTAAASLAFRGPLAVLRGRRRGVVLSPLEPGSAEVFGVDLGWAADPVRAHAPGRGVTVHGRDVVPVQVASA